MVCTYCGKHTQVKNSRHQIKSNQVWRRRQCPTCLAIFTTAEQVDYQQAWAVWNGKALRPFLRDKLFMSLYKSCEHRKTALSDAKGLTDTVISKLPTHMIEGKLTTDDIRRVVIVALNRFDGVASVHYQAFHA